MKIEHKILIAVAIVLFGGTAVTVGLLGTSAEETDNIVNQYKRSTQQFHSTTVATVIETVEQETPPVDSEETPTVPPGTKPALTEPDPNTDDGCYTNMAKKVTSMGIEYYGEKQEAPWTSGAQGHTLSQGCMWFAMSAAAGYVTGQPVYIHDLLHSCGCTSACKVANANSIDIQPKMNCVGQSLGTSVFEGSNVIATPPAILQAANLGLTVSEDKGKKPKDWYSQSFIDSGGVYLIHASEGSSKQLSSGGVHWYVVVGKTTSDKGDVYLIINGSGAMGKQGYSTVDYLNNTINHLFEVSK